MKSIRAVRAKIFTLMILAWAAMLPAFAIAQTTNCGAGQKCLQNPLRFPSIEQFIQGVLQAIVMIALPIITIFIVYAGFKYISARGNPSKIGDAHRNFMYVAIGAALILGAWVLATLIGGTVTQLLGGK
ncbi:MAG TPA: pilin [Candidatus Paceibacterota bacterium]|nr:pilin [Candidatus Paceibacterota bacterium]